MRAFLLVCGFLALLGGVIMMITGNMWGLLLFFLGFACIAAGSAMMMRTGGYRAEGAFFNGLNGQGRQQSEVSKKDYQPDEPNADIWKQLEQKQ